MLVAISLLLLVETVINLVANILPPFPTRLMILLHRRLRTLLPLDLGTMGLSISHTTQLLINPNPNVMPRVQVLAHLPNISRRDMRLPLGRVTTILGSFRLPRLLITRAPLILPLTPLERIGLVRFPRLPHCSSNHMGVDRAILNMPLGRNTPLRRAFMGRVNHILQVSLRLRRSLLLPRAHTNLHLHPRLHTPLDLQGLRRDLMGNHHLALLPTSLALWATKLLFLRGTSLI